MGTIRPTLSHPVKGYLDPLKVYEDMQDVMRTINGGLNDDNLAGGIALSKLSANPTSIGRVIWKTGADVALVDTTISAPAGKTASIAWEDATDATASTSAKTTALFVRIHLTVVLAPTTGGSYMDVQLRRKGDTDTTRKITLRVMGKNQDNVEGTPNINTMFDIVGVDADQKFEYATTISASWTYHLQVYLLGYVEDYA